MMRVTQKASCFMCDRSWDVSSVVHLAPLFLRSMSCSMKSCNCRTSRSIREPFFRICFFRNDFTIAIPSQEKSKAVVCHAWAHPFPGRFSGPCRMAGQSQKTYAPPAAVSRLGEVSFALGYETTEQKGGRQWGLTVCLLVGDLSRTDTPCETARTPMALRAVNRGSHIRMAMDKSIHGHRSEPDPRNPLLLKRVAWVLF